MLERSSISRHKALEYELRAAQAAALGRAGREVWCALETLRAASTATDAQQTKLLYAAARAVWRYFVQREACGFVNHDVAIGEYAIPQRVLARVGAREP